MTGPFVPVTTTNQIPDKGFACFEVNGHYLLIAEFRGEYFAVENLCSHALATFDNGRLRGPRIMCPLHGATFDVRDGSCTGLPAKHPIRSFPVRVEGDSIKVSLSSREEIEA